MPNLDSLSLVHSSSRPRGRFRLPVRLLGCASLVGLATLFGGTIDHGLFLWIANGVLLTYLLLAPRRLWPAYLAAGFLGHIAISPWMHAQWSIDLFFAPHDMIETTLAALLLRRRSSELPDFTNSFYLLRFGACALLAAPLLVSFAYSISFTLWQHQSFLHNWGTWFLADSVGVLLTTPAMVTLFRSRSHGREHANKSWVIIILVIAFCAVLLGLPSFVGPSLIFPLLVFVVLGLGLEWACVAALASTAISAWYTVHGIGPFALAINYLPPGLRLQGFMISVMVVLYSVAVVLENLRKTERRLKEIATLHALVAENSRDVILLLDFEGGRNFISSPEHFWGGWSREEILRTGRFELIHPEDRDNLTAVLNDLRTRNEGALTEARIRRKDSTYGWLELSLRTVRDPISHLPTGVLANIREITERKQAEQQLEDAFHAVEALSVTDPLTGLANRRRFDQMLAAEWRRALREQDQISLLLIDADHFKDFNDMYGHPRGDTCLKLIANAVRCGATRSGDLAARIGGEEFAVVLPNTTRAGAFAIADHIVEQLHTYAVPHAGNPSGIATVSIGCATLIPQLGQPFAYLVDLADQALYAAKHDGRNCVRPLQRIEISDSLAAPHEHIGLA